MKVNKILKRIVVPFFIFFIIGFIFFGERITIIKDIFFCEWFNVPPTRWDFWCIGLAFIALTLITEAK